jgi:hypothetical protein
MLAISGNSNHFSFKKTTNKLPLIGMGVPQLLFLCASKPHAKIQIPRTIPSGIKVTRGEDSEGYERLEEEKTSLIVANSFCCNDQVQRTHFTRTDYKISDSVPKAKDHTYYIPPQSGVCMLYMPDSDVVSSCCPKDDQCV